MQTVPKFHLPIEANDTSSIADISGNGYNGVLGGGTVVKDGTRYALNLSGGMESRIPYDLPWGKFYTLFLDEVRPKSSQVDVERI